MDVCSQTMLFYLIYIYSVNKVPFLCVLDQLPRLVPIVICMDCQHVIF